MRSGPRRRGVARFKQPVPLLELGTIQGHHIQAIAERSTFIVDGERAILCTPLEYQLAALLLRCSPGVPLRDDHLLAALSTDRRSLGDLITALRKKLLRPLGLHIVSVPRYGYLLLEQADDTGQGERLHHGGQPPSRPTERHSHSARFQRARHL